MLAMGTHFLPDADPRNVGYKTLAVNLSDLAAAGATPRAFFLSIGLPDKNDAWIEAFSEGLMELAKEAGCALLGGDTVRTPKNPVTGEHSPAVFSITAMGDLPPGLGLTRAGAKPGDDIWVSGTLGDAYAALKYRWGHWAAAPEAVRLMSRPDGPPRAPERARPGASARSRQRRSMSRTDSPRTLPIFLNAPTSAPA